MNHFRVTYNIDPRIDRDQNGYYHLKMDANNFQTLHRISGHIYKDDEPFENVKFYWESSHYWLLDDSVGYLVYHDGTADLVYTSHDTIYITAFTEFMVPTINCCSYSNSAGEVNAIFGPVITMRHDTVLITIKYFPNDDQYYYEGDIREMTLNVVLE